MARKKVAALLVDVLVDAGVERAYGIWSLEFRELAFCGMVGKLIIRKNSAWNMSQQRVPVLAIAAQIPSKEIGSVYFSGDSSGPSLRAM
jgi:thiamine pyrophosphate-dependent acetolactate synthase large subunit-like protein